MQLCLEDLEDMRAETAITVAISSGEGVHEGEAKMQASQWPEGRAGVLVGHGNWLWRRSSVRGG